MPGLLGIAVVPPIKKNLLGELCILFVDDGSVNTGGYVFCIVSNVTPGA